jgi:enoyl-CoA hydratase/carnithine racemase
MQDRIRLSIDQGVADLRLNRPDKMNALDQAMFDALVDAGLSLIAQPGLRAVVLSGEGRAFCAGLDMGRFEKIAAPGTDSSAHEMRLKPRKYGKANGAQYAALVWQDIPVPVIAAVHGAALGGGFQIMLGADMRFVAPDTKMAVMEMKWGLVPDMGGLALMRHLARDDVVRELTYSARVFTGAEALALGFATRVCAEPYAEAMAFAREIASKSPDAIRAAKRLFNLAQHADPATMLQAESDEQVGVMGKLNQVEAVTANLQKRAPRFIDAA